MGTELTPLGMLDEGKDDVLTRDLGPVREQLSSRGLSLCPVLSSSLSKRFCLGSISLCYCLSNIVSSNNQSIRHCVSFLLANPGALLQTPGYKISLGASLG